MRFPLAFLSSLLCIAAHSAIAQNTVTRFNLGCSSGECIIAPFDVQGPSPEYLIRGKGILEHDFSVVNRLAYRQAARRFPSALSCLTSKDSGQGHDLAKVNWAEIKTPEQFKICLSRIHSVLQSPENSVIWFTTLGFRAKQGRVRVFASWPQAQPFPGTIRGGTIGDRAPSIHFTVSVEHAPDGRVTNVNADGFRR